MTVIESLPFSDTVKDKLKMLVRLILNSIDTCEKIVLFGSYARAEYTGSSDLDILVLTETEIPREIKGKLCSIFEENNADLVFYTKSKFEQSDCLLVKQIKREGVLLWTN